MTRYTVVWHALAQDELADIWLGATDRNAITAAANTIDTTLAIDPSAQGASVSSRSRELTSGPLHVLFRVIESDRIVQVFSVTRTETN